MYGTESNFLRPRARTLLLFTLLVAPTVVAEDRALLIGVERYQDHRIARLPGCDADATEMAELLRQGFGLKDDQIRVLCSADATHERIRDALGDWLMEGTQPGDRVVFYFSGHGSQTPDDDEDEQDGLDEILCPSDYDPISQFGMLRDDVLGEAFRRLDGRNITVILDACHSGTAYKTVEGRVYPDSLYLSDNVTPKFLFPPGLPQPSGAGESAMARGEPAPTAGSMIDDPARNEVVFTACADSQRAEVATFVQGHRVYRRSVFTRALLQGLAGGADGNRDGRITNAEAFGFVCRQLSLPGRGFTQTPLMHCSELYRQQPVFGRTLTLAGPARLFHAAGRQATINRGSYHDVEIGDRFVLTAQDVPASSPAEVQVTSVSQFLSSGTLSKDIHFRPPGVEVQPVPRLRRFEKLNVFFGRFASVTGDPVEVPPVLRAAAASIPEVAVVADPARCLRIVSGLVAPDGSLQVFIYGRYGRLRSQFSSPLLTAGVELERRLRAQVLLEQLAVLENPAPYFHINLSVKDGRERFLIYPEGDPRREKIELLVSADRDCHLTLLSIDSRGQVTLLLPNKWQPDTKIVAGRTYTVPPPGAEFAFPIMLPPGHDTVRAIATRNPLKLRHVNTKGLEQQGFAQFDTAYLSDLVEDIRTRGIGLEPAPPPGPISGEELTDIPTAAWSTATLMIETVLP